MKRKGVMPQGMLTSLVKKMEQEKQSIIIVSGELAR